MKNTRINSFTVIMVGLALTMQANADLKTGLIAYWPLDSNVLDLSGNGHDGINFGASGAPDHFGDAGKAMTFDGITNYIQIPADDALGPQFLSIAAWVRTTQVNSAGKTTIVSNNPLLCQEGYTLGVADTGNDTIVGTGNVAPRFCNSAPIATDQIIGDGNWHQLTFTYDGTQRLYVDGILQSSEVGGGHAATNGTSIGIGRDLTNSNEFFIGDIDEVRIYDRALINDEVIALVNGGGFLEVTPAILIAGQDGTFTITESKSGTNTFLAYSLKGPGSTIIPFLNITIDLQSPKQAGPTMKSDGTGFVQWILPIPAGAVGNNIWFQAVQDSRKTNLVGTVIQ